MDSVFSSWWPWVGEEVTLSALMKLSEDHRVFSLSLFELAFVASVQIICHVVCVIIVGNLIKTKHCLFFSFFYFVKGKKGGKNFCFAAISPELLFVSVVTYMIWDTWRHPWKKTVFVSLGVLHLQRSNHWVCGVSVREFWLWQCPEEAQRMRVGE